MKKVLRIISVFILIMAITLPMIFVENVYADTAKFEYLNTGGDGDSDDIYGSNFVAMQFTSDATAHTVTAIRVMLKRTGNPGTVIVSLRNASGGVPSQTIDLIYGTLNGNNLSTSYSWREVTMNVEFALESNTQYAIVVSAEDGDVSNYINWQIDSGGGLANAESSHSNDNGVTWVSDTPEDCLFEIWGNIVLNVVGANAFQGYLQTGDLLVTAEILNIYPPYVSSGIPSEYFYVQLLALDYTTILASVPLTAWGYSPQGIYLNASSVTPLTIGGAYRIRVVDSLAGTVSAYYDLTSADWKGTDLIWLDKWIIKTAYNIDDYYGYTGSDSIVSEVTDVGQVLTDNGGAIFTNGIPGISQVRPNKFIISKSKPEFDVGTDGNTYDSSKDYQTLLGSEVSGDLDTAGDLFSISGKNFGGLLIGVIVCLVLFVGIMLGGRGGIPLMLVGGLPILFIGNYVGLIGIQWTLVLAIAMVILFVWSMFWSRT
jgi:hypothetical protein